MLKTLLAIGTFSLLAACATDAQAQTAGTWRLNPAKCPDLREDRRDARVVTGRRDLREDRRDRRTINCPARAFTYVAPRGVRVVRTPRPNFSRIYIDRRGHYYGVNGRNRVRLVIVG